MSIDTKSWKAFAAAHAPDLTRTVLLPGLVKDPGRLARPPGTHPASCACGRSVRARSTTGSPSAS
ncbi:hypothetical protein [Streptomyces sp. NPDC093105]|uniref:hypothetical protein n=1 Tax=Streptomyces sp. NPDC093105 TaxID=3366029 RepID=UPI00381E560C